MSKRSQVCDRCRLTKRACIGGGDTCLACLRADIKCQVTVKLKRKRKPNSSLEDLGTNDDGMKIIALENRIKELESQLKEDTSNDLVFCHLGRLLPGSKESIFAGSTTGDFFMRQIQNEVNEKMTHSYSFTETASLAFRSTSELHRRLKNAVDISFLNDLDQVEMITSYKRDWNSLYPFLDDVTPQTILPNNELEKFTTHTIYTHFMIICIQLLSNNDIANAATLFRFLQEKYLVSLMEPPTMAVLKCYLVTMIYLQLVGNHDLCLQFNGMAVRLAFLFGLHRHSFRFNFSPAEVEFRKSYWWCVYILDLQISCNNGLPKLIKDEDVDTELPIEFNKLTLQNIEYPLPGEKAKNSGFVLLVKLFKVLNEILASLYTTTERRNGIPKITLLRRKLDHWREEFLSVHEETSTERIITLLYYSLMIHLYRPGLTFPKEVEFFQHSLQESVVSSQKFIIQFEKIKSEVNGRVHVLYLVGFHMLFQCSLLLQYADVLVVTNQISLPSHENSKKYIETATRCLDEVVETKKFGDRVSVISNCSYILKRMNDMIKEYDTKDLSVMVETGNILGSHWEEQLELLFLNVTSESLNLDL